MVEKRIADYYQRIIEQIPELQLVDEKTAHRIIYRTVRKYFSVMRNKLKQNPYCRLEMKTKIAEFYIPHKDAYRLKKIAFKISNRNAFHAIADLDETRLPALECSQFQEWETNW